MKNRLLSVSLSALAVAVGLSFVATAQQSTPTATEFKAKKLTNVAWYELRYTSFKPGKMAEAMKIINEQFVPASESAGLPAPVRYFHTAGKWDLTTVFAMPGGVSELEWEIHPDAEKWMNALAQHCGGMDKAKALREQYVSLVAEGESQIVYVRNPDSTARTKN